MASPYYPSAKKTRQQVFATQKVVIEQNAVLRQLDARTTDHTQRLDTLREQLDALLERGFFGRLWWIVAGR